MDNVLLKSKYKYWKMALLNNALGHLNITDAEKLEIACKLASKIPLASILDDIRDSVSNNKLEKDASLNKKRSS
nr:unnamed protein product [Callosobruchus analis]